MVPLTLRVRPHLRSGRRALHTEISPLPPPPHLPRLPRGRRRLPNREPQDTIRTHRARPSLPLSTSDPAPPSLHIYPFRCRLRTTGTLPCSSPSLKTPPGVFTVLPRQGVVPRGASVLLAVRFAPPKVSATLAQFCAIQRNSAQLFERPVSPAEGRSSYHGVTLHSSLNTGAAPVPIELHGAGTEASLIMEHGGDPPPPDHLRRVLFLVPCLKLTNPSRIGGV